MALYSAHSAFDVSILTYIKRARRLLAHLEGPILLLGGSEHGHAAFIVLQECVIITQCVLAISYLSLARQGHLEGKRRAMSAISELVSVTKTLEQEDMDAIDPFPMVRGSSTLQRRELLMCGHSTAGTFCRASCSGNGMDRDGWRVRYPLQPPC
jgi:hypothetical protein